MWSKGAVVVVKKGDPEFADAIEKGVTANKMVPKKDMEETERENAFMKKRYKESLENDIATAQIQYGHNWVTPTWLKPLAGLWALIVYGISVFVDKFMTIKEWDE